MNSNDVLPCVGSEILTAVYLILVSQKTELFTLFTRARHWLLSRATRIKSTPPYLVLEYILILVFHLPQDIPYGEDAILVYRNTERTICS
jgi:hypothetical protein